VELAKDWRTDKMLRILRRCWWWPTRPDLPDLRVGRRDRSDEPLAAIGSGGPYATAAARALLENTDLGAREIAEKAMKIAEKSAFTPTITSR